MRLHFRYFAVGGRYTCQSSGEWSGEGSCQAVACLLIPEFENAVVSSSNSGIVN